MTANKPEVVAWINWGVITGGASFSAICESEIASEPLIRLDEYDSLQYECERLRQALVEARDLVAEWGDYASDYFKEKHGLERDIARLDAVISGEE